jgi:integrase
MAGRRRFGRVRKLPSGRWQARYPGPDGVDRPAPETFARKGDAERFLALAEAQLVSRSWRDPEAGRVPLADYGDKWIKERGLRPRTVELYRWLLGRYITPRLGRVNLVDLDTPMIREWRAELLDSGVSPVMAAKAYRLLRAVLMTAAEDDEIIPRNPCRVRGADREHSGERPVLTPAQVFALAERMPARLAPLVLVAAFGSLRWGEVTALRRSDVDVTAGTVRVQVAYVELRDGSMLLGPPKSRAGVRTVSLPAAVTLRLGEHLGEHVGPGRDALLFTGPKGGPLRRSNFNPLVSWKDATAAVGVPHLTFHDLRHTGATLAAQTGASLRDLMQRIGHDSTAAAIRYQHASREADDAIAAALNAVIEAAQNDPGSGT